MGWCAPTPKLAAFDARVSLRGIWNVGLIPRKWMQGPAMCPVLTRSTSEIVTHTLLPLPHGAPNLHIISPQHVCSPIIVPPRQRHTERGSRQSCRPCKAARLVACVYRTQERQNERLDPTCRHSCESCRRGCQRACCRNGKRGCFGARRGQADRWAEKGLYSQERRLCSWHG